jgi:hypothetical protein
LVAPRFRLAGLVCRELGRSRASRWRGFCGVRGSGRMWGNEPNDIMKGEVAYHLLPLGFYVLSGSCYLEVGEALKERAIGCLWSSLCIFIIARSCIAMSKRCQSSTRIADTTLRECRSQSNIPLPLQRGSPLVGNLRCSLLNAANRRHEVVTQQHAIPKHERCLAAFLH